MVDGNKLGAIDGRNHRSKDGKEAGPSEGIRKGILRVSKSRHNTRTINKNMTYKGQKDGPPDGLIDDSNKFPSRIRSRNEIDSSSCNRKKYHLFYD